MKNEELIAEMFAKGILVNKDLLDRKMETLLFNKIEMESDLLVLNSDYVSTVEQENRLFDWYEIDRTRVAEEKIIFNKSQTVLALSEPKSLSESELKSEPLEVQQQQNENNCSTKVEIVSSYDNIPKKYTIQDFGNFFTSRYRFLESLLRNRPEMKNILTVNRILSKKEKEDVSLIGVIGEINTTRNGNLMISVEDFTGEIRICFTKNKPDSFSLAKELTPDEVVGISGSCGDKIIFANNIIWPEFIGNTEMKKSSEEEYAIFLSDIHVGSDLFLKEEFNKFLEWINGRLGDEKHQLIAQKVKYIFIVGDAVDGIGIYADQEEELAINDLKGQYTELFRLLKQIPSDKQIIVCPGNHEVHLAEPQPPIYLEYAPELYTLPNLMMVTNPAMINIGKTENFSGFDVLMYHGYSFDYYVANVESLRNSGGYRRADLIMKYLLKRRHLAPSFKSTPYFPGYQEDPLLIRKIPDFFITGHIHYSSVANYKGISMVCCSCWQAKTSFQEKLGHEPEPARLPIVNLKTREIKVLRF